MSKTSAPPRPTSPGFGASMDCLASLSQCIHISCSVMILLVVNSLSSPAFGFIVGFVNVFIYSSVFHSLVYSIVLLLFILFLFHLSSWIFPFLSRSVEKMYQNCTIGHIPIVVVIILFPVFVQMLVFLCLMLN